MAWLAGRWSCTPKGHQFNSQSGHMPRLWIWSHVQALMKGNQLMFPSYIEVSFLPHQKNQWTCPQMRIAKKKLQRKKIQSKIEKYKNTKYTFTHLFLGQPGCQNSVWSEVPSLTSLSQALHFSVSSLYLPFTVFTSVNSTIA